MDTCVVKLGTKVYLRHHAEVPGYLAWWTLSNKPGATRHTSTLFPVRPQHDTSSSARNTAEATLSAYGLNLRSLDWWPGGLDKTEWVNEIVSFDPLELHAETEFYVEVLAWAGVPYERHDHGLTINGEEYVIMRLVSGEYEAVPGVSA